MDVMKIFTLILASFLLTAIFSLEIAAQQAGPKIQRDNELAVDLYRRLATEDSSNLFYSPTSIAMALSMTANGADGDTRSQMLATLHIEDLEEANDQYAALLEIWNDRDKAYQLSIANRLWGQKGYDLLPEFLEVTRNDYKAPMELLDFQNAPNPSRKKINTWVESQTAEKIKTLLPAGSITPLTRLVLTNAIYFQGDWKTQFKKEATREADFTTTAGDAEKVPLMYLEDRFALAETAKVQAILLPYQGDEISMVVVLPRKTDGLPRLEKELHASTIQELTSKARHQKVKVFLPKFKLETSFNLNKVLIDLGMSDAFDASKADFSRMTAGRDLYITDVVHKAFVDVDEQGTEAAAATGVVMGLRSMPNKPTPTFRADHPFIFAIRDNRSGAILFMGRYVSP